MAKYLRNACVLWIVVLMTVCVAAVAEFLLLSSSGFRYRTRNEPSSIGLLRGTLSVTSDGLHAIGCVLITVNDPAAQNLYDVAVVDLSSYALQLLGVTDLHPCSARQSPDGAWLAVGSHAGLPVLIDRNSGERHDLLERNSLLSPVRCWAFTPCGRFVTAATDTELLVWRLEDLELVWRTKLAHLSNLQFQRDSLLAYVTSQCKAYSASHGGVPDGCQCLQQPPDPPAPWTAAKAGQPGLQGGLGIDLSHGFNAFSGTVGDRQVGLPSLEEFTEVQPLNDLILAGNGRVYACSQTGDFLAWDLATGRRLCRRPLLQMRQR